MLVNEVKTLRNLYFLRKAKGLTQENLAKELGVTSCTLSIYERGQSEPRVGIAYDIAQYFGVSVEQLLGKAPLSVKF